MSGRNQLPSSGDMVRDVEASQKALGGFLSTQRNETCLYAIWSTYMQWMAEAIGCKPRLLKYMFTDWPLFRSLFFGVSVPAQYRLEGPHSWAEARNHILATEKRIESSMG
jgi:dimethylaniline monooxygenase (N-oxide forming)